MCRFLVRFVLPLLLLAAALLNWSLISLVDLIAFLFIQFIAPKIGFHFRSCSLLLWPIIVFSVVVIILQVMFLTIWAVDGSNWNLADVWWANLIGFMGIQSWRSPTSIYFLVSQSLAFLVSLVEIYAVKFGVLSWKCSFDVRFSSCIEQLGSQLRVVLCFLLPIVQLVVGISYPSWVSLPFFIGSCVGLVHWSLTGNFLGLFRWWKPLQMYAGFNIALLYAYQLPLEYSRMLQRIAEFIGLYRISGRPEWTEICSGVSLIIFYITLSYVRCDLEEMDCHISVANRNLSEQLLPSKHSFFSRESRSGVRHTNVVLSGEIFQTFSINFFTYGFPVSLIAVSFWSFHFASVCALGLLAYVGYIVYTFPSLFRLHRLNGLLLVFILFWALGTYIFNVAFVFLKWKVGQDMEIWEIVGLWHYPIPGLYLLAQFCLGILVTVGNLVNNSVFGYLSKEDGQSLNGSSIEVEDNTKVLIVAAIAWGLRKCSRPIMLTLIYLIAIKPGFIHAVYMIFFLIYLLSHDIGKKIRQSLILLCEAHFAVLYIIQLNLISKYLEQSSSSMDILSQLGLVGADRSRDFLEIALLACFCAVHNHGFEMLFSFSAIMENTPSLPIGFSILKAGLNKSVLLSVYASHDRHDNSIHERRITSFLSAIGQKFLCVYRSCGTYIAFLTILVTVYLVWPNYISFGYVFLLLFWIIGRQVVEKSKRRLWFPLKAYAILVFIFVYSLCIFSRFELWVSKVIDLYPYLGYKPEASSFENVWESLAILIVMQLYSYERRQSKYSRSNQNEPIKSGVIGFIRRLLVWHSQKILFVSLFYASVSPISMFGFLYLFGMIICSTLPKASRLPSKSFLIYTGFLVTAEYLYQMWGKQVGMFPGQNHSELFIFLGFREFQPGFWGIEAGLRGKVIVVVACSLQYNVFRWVEKMPSHLINIGKWEETCPLFVSAEDTLNNGVSVSNHDPIQSTPSKQTVGISKSWPSLDSAMSQASYPSKIGGSEGCDGSSTKYSFQYIWNKESFKWNKKRTHSLRNERFEMQKTTLKVYLKFWMENLFNLFGLEINMVALLLASFAVLNAISMLYIAALAACILLNRHILRKLWPLFVFLFASILILEYFAIWKNMVIPSNANVTKTSSVYCHDCWRSSNVHFHYCINCWLGLIMDDPQTLISYYTIFMLSCFKIRADRLASFSESSTYRQIMSQRMNSFVWRDLCETKSMWTILDYTRLYFYCHLLDLVLVLILITGTLEYDILHLGYLCFALVFFRIRLKILKKKNEVFKFLRIYNFALIVLSLTYQSPFLGEFSEETCDTIDYIYEVIGFYKYDHGFRITSRSALVEIIIFLLVSLQSYIFSSQEFGYVSQYLKAEQIGAIVLEQEKKTTWKTAQLQHIRESEEKKRLRNLQVEKMKSEMLNLQNKLRSTNLAEYHYDTSSGGGLRKRSTSLGSNWDTSLFKTKTDIYEKPEHNNTLELPFPLQFHESPIQVKSKSPLGFERNSIESPICEITEFELDAVGGLSFESNKTEISQSKDSRLVSAVQLINDSVSQVQSIGNKAVSNLANFLNIAPEDSDLNEHSNIDDAVYDELEKQDMSNNMVVNRSYSLQSDKSRTVSDAASLQIGRIICHIWSQMRSNNDIVCYCCFIVVFLWNFSLLSMAYLAALFIYALCVNTGPGYIFWVGMLIFTEFYILIQYLYQIIIQHCGLRIKLNLLHELGFPTGKITSSFVVSSLPLFLVYSFTLIQSFITIKDGEWMCYTKYKLADKKIVSSSNVNFNVSLHDKAQKLLSLVTNFIKMTTRSLSTYWKSVTQGAESLPYFVQLSMAIRSKSDDGIQPERIESGINQVLKISHDDRCKANNPNDCSHASVIRVQSIERSDDSSVVLAVFEVVYASPLKECEHAGYYKSLTPAADVANEILKAQNAGFIDEVGFPYPILSVLGGGKREVDLYAYIFGADLTVFFLVAIFYQSVIKNNTQFLEAYQLEDQFPKEFVFVLMVIFFLIVLDRIIYLCSFSTGKVLFYLFNLILYTYSVTKYAWHVQPLYQHAGLFTIRAIYTTKLISLALQAIQIRFGPPHKSSLYQQFLTSEISRINYLGYRLYRSLPFLYELRCVLDWSCTITSLTMYDWLKLEDIYASLYLVKCDTILNRAQHKQGEKQTRLTKFCNGICLFFILICVIWAPMLMYSSGNPTNIANPINDASVQVDIKTAFGGRLTLYQTSLCKRLPWDKVDSGVDFDPQHYLDAYDINDIQLICCQADASTLWLVPNTVLIKFTQSLEWDMSITFSWILNRDRPKGKEIVRFERSIEPLDIPKVSEVQKVLNGSANSFRILNVYPRYLRVTGSGDVRSIDQKDNIVSADLVLNRENLDWWSFHDVSFSNVEGCGGPMGPMAIVVSEETPPGFLGETLNKFSIWGLYITFVLAVGRFIRIQCSDLRMRIPYENLPSCERLIAICEDIYAARAEGELGVEEVLYWTLVKIYRSPDMLLEYTKSD